MQVQVGQAGLDWKTIPDKLNPPSASVISTSGPLIVLSFPTGEVCDLVGSFDLTSEAALLNSNVSGLSLFASGGALEFSADQINLTLDQLQSITFEQLFAGNDTITGGAGDDTLAAGAGNNSLDGGSGINTLDYSVYPAPVTVNFSNGTAANGFGGTDDFTNFQIFSGSTFNDTFIGGPGSHTVDGGAGIDTLDYSAAPAPVTINGTGGTNGGTGGSVSNGFGGTDTYTNFERYIGGSGNDTFIPGTTGGEQFDGGGGTNTLDLTSASAGFGCTVFLGTGTLAVWNSYLEEAVNDTFSNFQIFKSGGFGFTRFVGAPGSHTIDAGQPQNVPTDQRNILDYSAAPGPVNVNLSTGTASNGFGGTDTLLSGIAHVIGGGSNDLIISAAGSHTLDGGSGVNTAGYSNTRASYTIGFSGGIVQITGNGTTDALTGIQYLQFSDRTIKVPFRSVDLVGNGTSDILWRNGVNGETVAFLMSSGTVGSVLDLGAVSSAWVVAGIGDFDRDGNADILWRNTVTGDDVLFFMKDGAIASTADIGIIGTAWSIVGLDDFNGDGGADILWRNATTGDTVLFQMNGSAIAAATDLGVVSGAWSIVGTGDFDANGSADILWRNNLTGADVIFGVSNGTISSVTNLGTIATSWFVAGVGDFDGNGSSDILWRQATSGDSVLFFMNGNSISSTADLGVIGTSWSVAQIGDFNGDGKADILWRNNVGGSTVVFEMNGGSLAATSDLGEIGTNWSVPKPVLAVG
jgi:hypothetical protein